MGRAPCCEKMGLKKGPWTAEEDLILTNYINQNGHGNWRALPKRADLLRCGKSCRLRWMNYLRPDIKRGNFSREEEETIIKLHRELGNRWSIIAASLPGRTDNEIKNVWHTHLKKKLNKESVPVPVTQAHANGSFDSNHDVQDSDPNSPIHESSSDGSLTTTPEGGASGAGSRDTYMITDSTLQNTPGMDESFWSEVLSGDDSSATSDFWAGNSDSHRPEFGFGFDIITEGSMDFWYDLFDKGEGLIELPEF